jgi:hypothetical protein
MTRDYGVHQIEWSHGKSQPEVHLIVRKGDVLGMIERFRGQGEPWHAYRGHGADRGHLGAFYPSQTAGRMARDRAIDAIVNPPKAD